MSSKYFSFFSTLLICFGAIFFPGCHGKEDAKNNPTTWCVLVDMSGVRKSQDTRQHYADHFKTIFSKVMPGDALAVALITELSVTEPQLLLRHQFSTFKATTDNDLYVKAEKQQFEKDLQALKDSFLKKVTDTILHSNRITPRTDIITACHVAAGIFKQYPSLYRKLIILSDMEEFDGTYNFIIEKLTEKRIDEIIEKEKKSSRGIPDLAGVTVYVAGAASKQSDRFFNIRSFWKKYFKECGASLQDEHYGGTLSGL